MNRSLSIYLDAMRVAAALIVVLSHLALPFASGGHLAIIRDLNIGSDFVIIFFVLSGLVIAHTTSVKDKDISDFVVARLSRLYSVVIPALLLTWICHFLGILVAGIPSRIETIPMELLHALSFTNYTGGAAHHVVGNGPFWSVTYEFWYYALFAAWLYLGGSVRIAALGALAFFVGLPILLLLPAWVSGVLVYRVIQRGLHENLSVPGATALFFLPWAIYATGLVAGLPDLFLSFTENTLLRGGSAWQTLHFSDEFLWNNFIAILIAIHFFGAARLAMFVFVHTNASDTIQWWAGRTFSIYLFHLPIMKLVSRMPGYDATDLRHIVFNIVITMIACLLLATFTERRVCEWRNMFEWIRQRLAGLSRQKLLRSTL